MAQRPGKRRSFRQIVNCDLELRPLMNVFIVLIPMLLMSAVFMEIRVIEMTLPQAAEAAERKPQQPLDLTVRIRANAYVVEANGAAIQTIPRESGSGVAAPPGAAASTQLSNALGQIVAAHPDNKEVRILAEATTRYREIVALMDIARASGLPQAALEGAAVAEN